MRSGGRFPAPARRADRIRAMRVHLGSDHAGLDLKDHLLGWLTRARPRAGRPRPFVYDALDDYPVFCLRAAEAVAAERAEGRDSLGVVIGGSGNGEQIAANKVAGVRCALVWSEETAVLAREHNDANVVSRRRPDAHARRHDPVRRGLPRDRLLRRRAARPPDRPARRLRDRPASCRRCPSPRPGPTGRCLRATPSTGSPTSSRRAFAGRRVRVSSPQGRFADDAALLDGSRARRRRGRPASTCSSSSTGDRIVHVHLGLIGTFDVHAGVAEVPPPVGQVRLRLVAGTPRGASYADLRGATVCDLVGPARQRGGHRRPLGPDPLRPGRRPRRAPGRGSGSSRAPDRRPADGPGGARRRRQRLPRRGAVPAPDPPAAARQHPARRPVAGDVGRPRRR